MQYPEREQREFDEVNIEIEEDQFEHAPELSYLLFAPTKAVAVSNYQTMRTYQAAGSRIFDFMKEIQEQPEYAEAAGQVALDFGSDTQQRLKKLENPDFSVLKDLCVQANLPVHAAMNTYFGFMEKWRPVYDIACTTTVMLDGGFPNQHAGLAPFLKLFSEFGLGDSAEGITVFDLLMDFTISHSRLQKTFADLLQVAIDPAFAQETTVSTRAHMDVFGDRLEYAVTHHCNLYPRIHPKHLHDALMVMTHDDIPTSGWIDELPEELKQVLKQLIGEIQREHPEAEIGAAVFIDEDGNPNTGEEFAAKLKQILGEDGTS